MASLTQSAIVARKIIRYTIYAIVTIIILRYTILIGTRVYNSLFPEPPPPPTVQFGRLPEIPFSKTGGYEDLKFILETPQGGLPPMPPQANVFFMPKSVSNIRSLENAKSKAKTLGFNPEGNEINATVYAFRSDVFPTDLVMNIVTNVFSISYDLTQDPSVITGTAPLPDSAIGQAKSILKKTGLLAPDLSGPTTTELLRIEDGEFARALSLSETNFVKVNIFRKPYEGNLDEAGEKSEYPSMPPKAKEANVWMILGAAGRGGSRILAAEYYYYPVDDSQKATYPLKPLDKAWEELNSGRAYVASLGLNLSEGQIRIRNIYLAYFDPAVYTEFYQPIYVFEEGVPDGFVAYVPAVASEFYGQESPPEQAF